VGSDFFPLHLQRTSYINPDFSDPS
jgi:hypothetical protein